MARVQALRDERILWRVSTLTALALTHLRLIIQDPLLERDDLHHIRGIRPLSQYFGPTATDRPIDLLVLQPVKDLALALDLRATEALGFGTFHLTNLLIWIGILLLASRILEQVLGKSTLALRLTALFAVHPIFVGSIAWVSARKHLLSCLFILWATASLLKFIAMSAHDQKGHWRSFAAAWAGYLLSLLSHPIHLLWPIWAIAYARWGSSEPKRSERNAALGLALLCVPLLIGGLALNYSHYSDVYSRYISVPKFTASTESTLVLSVLAHGRYFFNLLFPIQLSPIYYPGAIPNILGVIALPFFALFAFKKLGARPALLWGGFYMIALIPVTARMTNVFVSDTYALTAGVGFTVLIGALAQRLLSNNPGIERYRRRGLILSISLFIVFSLLSWRQTRFWTSDRDFWAETYASEPSPRVLVQHAKNLLTEGKAKEATQVLLHLRSWEPGNEDLPYLLSKAVYQDKQLTHAQKTRALDELWIEDAWFHYHLGWVHAASGDFARAFARLEQALSSPARLGTELAVVLAEARYFCGRSGKRDCNMWLSARIQDETIARQWDPTKFDSRLKELKP